MHKKPFFTTRRIALAAMLAALTAVGSAIRITLPLSIAGTTSFHLGNIMCALSGIVLGPWFGALAAGLGSAIYDMFNPLYISDSWITFLSKGAYGLFAGLIFWIGPKNRLVYLKAILGAIAGASVYALLYLTKSYFYDGLLISGLTTQAAWATVVGKLPATAFNAVIAILAAPLLAITIRKALQKAHLSLE